MAFSPKVTVAVPLYQGRQTIIRALRSVQYQSFQDFEILVIDDGSTDGSAELVESQKIPNLRLLRNDKNTGLGFTRNRLLDEARGDYIAWLDQDDWSSKNRLQRQFQLMASRPDFAIFGGWYAVALFNQLGKSSGLKPFHVYRAHRTSTLSDIQLRTFQPLFNAFSTSSVMCSLVKIRKVGLRFRPERFPAEDYDFWNRVLEIGRGRILPAVLSYESPGGSSSSDSSKGLQIAAVQSVREEALVREGFSNENARVLAHLLCDAVTLARLERGELRLFVTLLQSYIDHFAREGVSYQNGAAQAVSYAKARKILAATSVKGVRAALELARGIGTQNLIWLLTRAMNRLR